MKSSEFYGLASMMYFSTSLACDGWNVVTAFFAAGVLGIVALRLEKKGR